MKRGLVVMALAACSFPRPADVKNEVSVGGTVHGLWTGADGVALRLTADGVDTLYSAASDGAFAFPTTLSVGTSYIVSIAADPTMHSCTLAAGARGTVGSADVTSIHVACVGPIVSIALSAPQPWVFDPTLTMQPTLRGSVLLHEVAVTVHNPSGDLVSAQVAEAPVVLGQPSSSQILNLGTTTIAVDVVAQGGLSKTYEILVERGGELIEQSLYGKSSNTGAGDRFVFVALSGDTLAVGAGGESSLSRGVNGDQTDNSASAAGAVYVFRRSRGKWLQEAYIKASNTDQGDSFGASLALDGDTLVVGAPNESSGDTGVNGDQTDNGVRGAGAAYVFQRVGTTWVQEAYLKASNTAPSAAFGTSVAVAGRTVAVGALNAASSGAVYIFQRSGNGWSQQTVVTPSNPDVCRGFGHSVALSGDTLAVAAPREPSSSTGVNGEQIDSAAPLAGAVYVFQRVGSTWMQQAYVKASNTGAEDFFGWSIALAGNILAVGAPGERSNAKGINGDQSNNSLFTAGAVYVLERTGAVWTHHSYIKASNTRALTNFGWSVAVSDDTLAVGALNESSAAMGVNGDESNDTMLGAGAVYAFQRLQNRWHQAAYIKASNTETAFFRGDGFGESVAISGDTLAVGAGAEDGSASGLDGNQTDNGAPDSGAVYVFR
jgi:trimeric autotransporter adhesin